MAVLTLVAVLAELLIAPTWTVHADPPPTAAQRCQAGAAPDMEETTTFSGSQVGTSFPTGSNPPNAIFPGDVVRVSINGQVRYDNWGNTIGPDGSGRPAESGYPFPGMLELSSIARWNNNPGGWVGGPPMQTSSLTRCTAAPASMPVRLLFYINDGNLSDNGGSWQIHTFVYRAASAVAISGVQVTQGVQTSDNQVPLIADKRTFVRVFVRNSDPAAAPIPSEHAALTVEGESRTYTPTLTSSVTSTAAGSDPRNLTDNFLFELDSAATTSGSRFLTVTVTTPTGSTANRLIPTWFGPSGVANLYVYGARYSYTNVPPVLQQQVHLSTSVWPARPVWAWEPIRRRAENALPLARLTINDVSAGSASGSASFDCRATQNPTDHTWGCAGYTTAKAWAENQIDQICPNGGCWFALLQPEIDINEDGTHWPSPRHNHVINLQGEATGDAQGNTLAHEIGHGFGLAHTWDDATYPRSNGALGPFFGLRYSPTFSVVTGTAPDGTTTAYDLMSYTRPAWFSPHNYCKALQESSNHRMACPNWLVG